MKGTMIFDERPSTWLEVVADEVNRAGIPKETTT
jgi:hypothetical protein